MYTSDVSYPAALSIYSDAARHCSDAVNRVIAEHLHEIAAGRRIWLAIRLDSGRTDGVLYDTRADAVRHQLHETLCAYLLVPVKDMTPREAESYLRFHRQAYDSGHRLTDPEQPAYIPALTNEQRIAQERAFRRKIGRPYDGRSG